MKKVFLLILAGGMMMTACKKEEKANVSGVKEVVYLKGAPVKPQPASNGRKYDQQVDPDDCINTPEACAPFDVVVTPTGTTIKSYMNFLNSISTGREHEFFANQEEVKALFPFLLEEEWKEFYELCLREDMKFIEVKMPKNNKYFYFLVTEDTKPENFKPGVDDYLDLVVILEK